MKNSKKEASPFARKKKNASFGKEEKINLQVLENTTAWKEILTPIRFD